MELGIIGVVGLIALLILSIKYGKSKQANKTLKGSLKDVDKAKQGRDALRNPDNVRKLREFFKKK